MRLAVNLSFLRPSVGGSYIYAASVLECLSRRADVEVSIFGVDGVPKGVDPEGVAITSVPGRRLAAIGGHQVARMWTEFAGARMIRDLDRVDVVWSPGNTVVSLGRRAKAIQVVTIHDLIHLSKHNPLSRAGTARRSSALGRSVSRADRIVVPSASAAAAVKAKYGSGEGVVIATGEGVNVQARRTCLKPVPAAFILCPSTDHSHKNHELLFRSCVRAGLNESGSCLVLTGFRYKGDSALVELAHACGLDIGRVVDLHHLDDHGEVLDLISRAQGVVFPSSFEGWGLPVLEALALGRPAVAHCVGGIPEFAGPGLRVPTFGSIEDWSHHVRGLLDGDKKWNDAARADSERVRSEFSWEVVANRLVHACRLALEKRPEVG